MREAKLQGELGEFDQTRQELDKQRQSIVAEREAIVAERAALDNEHSTLAADRKSLETERTEWQAELERVDAELTARLETADQQQAAVEKRQVELTEAERALQESQAQLLVEQSKLAEATRTLADQQADLAKLEQQLQAARDEQEQQQEQLATEQQTLTRAQAEFNRQLTEHQQSLAELSTPVDTVSTEPAVNPLQAELDHTNELLQGEQEKLQQVTQQWNTERAALQAQLAEQAALQKEIERLQSELIEQRSATQGMVTQQQETSEIDDRLAQLEKWASDLERQSEELAEYRQQLVAAQDSCQQDRAALERERATLTAEQETFAVQAATNSAATSRHDSDEESDADASSPRPRANSDLDVFARLREMALLKEDENDSSHEQEETHRGRSAPIVSNGQEPAQVAATVVHPAESTASTEEESIDDYMAKLLNRVRTPGSQSQSTHSAAPVVTPTPQVEQVAPTPAIAEIPVQEAVPTKLIPRSQAPEWSTNLQAMRDLANVSARSAIEAHVFRRWGQAATSKLLIGVSALVVGLAAMWFASGKNSVIFMAGSACLVVSLFWFLQAGILARNIIQVTRREKQIAKRRSEAAAQVAAKKAEQPGRADAKSVAIAPPANAEATDSPTLISAGTDDEPITNVVTADVTDGESTVVANADEDSASHS